MLNEDALSHWLGRDNVGYAMIEGNRMLVLLDMGTNVNMITLECVAALGLQVGPLMDLCKGGITMDQPSFMRDGPRYVIMRPMGYNVHSHISFNGLIRDWHDQLVRAPT